MRRGARGSFRSPHGGEEGLKSRGLAVDAEDGRRQRLPRCVDGGVVAVPSREWHLHVCSESFHHQGCVVAVASREWHLHVSTR